MRKQKLTDLGIPQPIQSVRIPLYLKLYLVSCPIALYTATSSAERVAFRQINKKTDIAEVKIPKDMLALAEHILESKAAKFDSSKFHDRWEAAIVAMIKRRRRDCRSRSNTNSRGSSPARILCRRSGKAMEKAKAEAQNSSRPSDGQARRERKGQEGCKTEPRPARAAPADRWWRDAQASGRKADPEDRYAQEDVLTSKPRPRAAPSISGGFFITTKAGALEMANDALGHDGGHVLGAQRQSLKLSSFGSSNPTSNRRL